MLKTGVAIFLYVMLSSVCNIKSRAVQKTQEMSLKKTNGVGLKKEENITQG